MKFTNATYEPKDREYFLASINTFLTLGTCSYVGEADLLNLGRSQVMIGRYSSLAGVTFISLNHVYKNTVSTFPFFVERIKKAISTNGHPYSKVACFTDKHRNLHRQFIVGSDVWIGRGVTINGGVKIGSGAIIGTNAMVTKDIPPYAIAAGNPARVTKYRFDESTVKKFMAVKWWNWNVDKVVENVPLMNDPEKFLSKHYSPELEKFSEENICIGGGGDYKKIYTFIADINTLQPVWGANIAGFQRTVSMPLWKRVLSGFCQSDFENSLLIVWTGKNSNQTDLQVLSDYISSFGNNAGKNIIVYPSTEEEIFSPCIVRNSTHFITTREIISLECMDYLWDTDVRIVSALDEDIFENEPRVEWGKIFEGV